MAVRTNASGGGGLDTDELTALAGDVLKGKTAGVKGSDDPVAGTLELTGSAADSQVLAGQTYYNTDPKVKRSGTMPNNGGQSASLNCGQSKVIPAGYTTGGTVTANSLASQTGGVTADDAKVLSGYTYWRDGAKRTGNLTVQSVVNFNVAQYSNLTLIGTWAKPLTGPWSGIRILCKQGSYPTSVSDGTLFYEGGETFATKTLSVGTWYFRAWNYITTSVGRMYGGDVQAAATNKEIKGQQVFTSSGVFYTPAFVRSVEVFVVGGGGGSFSDESNRSGGGAGGYTQTYKIDLQSNTGYMVVIGAGGQGSGGGATSFWGYSASGGGGGKGTSGGDGGSGGGCATSGDRDYAGDGGSDGSNGAGRVSGEFAGGKGQGRTTRAFGEPSGALYAGGGGGRGYESSTWSYSGRGGTGGGGYGNGNPGNGSANTGGGGGGRPYYGSGYSPYPPSIGGSGICIIRWGLKEIIT